MSDREAAAISGLAKWRQNQAEDKRRRMAELKEYRRSATVEVVEGRRYKVVRIPDRYEFTPLRSRW